jgi:hypothetical protein
MTIRLATPRHACIALALLASSVLVTARAEDAPQPSPGPRGQKSAGSSALRCCGDGKQQQGRSDASSAVQIENAVRGALEIHHPKGLLEDTSFEMDRIERDCTRSTTDKDSRTVGEVRPSRNELPQAVAVESGRSS